MTKICPIARPLLALAAVLVAAPLAAEPSMTVTGQPMAQERVSFADLDLRRGGAQQTLQARVKRASARVCRQAEGPFPAVGVPGYGRQDPSLSCTDLTYVAARPQVRAAIDRARSGQPQIAMAFVISAPRAR